LRQTYSYLDRHACVVICWQPPSSAQSSASNSATPVLFLAVHRAPAPSNCIPKFNGSDLILRVRRDRSPLCFLCHLCPRCRCFECLQSVLAGGIIKVDTLRTWPDGPVHFVHLHFVRTDQIHRGSKGLSTNFESLFTSGQSEIQHLDSPLVAPQSGQEFNTSTSHQRQRPSHTTITLNIRRRAQTHTPSSDTTTVWSC